MNFYQCPVCKDQLFNTPSYKTVDGKVCEDCYESRKGEKSAYDFYLEEKLNPLLISDTITLLTCSEIKPCKHQKPWYNKSRW